PVEAREDERADVLAVDVGVGHDDELVVAELVELEPVLAFADARADGGDQRADLVVGENLDQSGLLDVEDLALDRQDRLEHAVAALLGRAAGRVALDDEELG